MFQKRDSKTDKDCKIANSVFYVEVPYLEKLTKSKSLESIFPLKSIYLESTTQPKPPPSPLTASKRGVRFSLPSNIPPDNIESFKPSINETTFETSDNLPLKVKPSPFERLPADINFKYSGGQYYATPPQKKHSGYNDYKPSPRGISESQSFPKPVTETITVRHLHSLADDGILDNDDVLSDVVDDKDVLIAVFEEETLSVPPSVQLPDSIKAYSDKGSVNSIHTLQNKGNSVESKESAAGVAEQHSIHSDHSSTSEVQHKANNDSDYCSGSNQSREYEQPAPDPRVTKWVENATKSSLSSIKEPREVRNIIEHEELTRNLSMCSNISRVNNNWSCQDEILSIDIEKGNSALGLKLQPRTRPSDSRDSGVYVVEIDPDSPASRDGRLRVNDRIDSINGVNLIDIPNNKALDIYEGIAITASVRLNVTRMRESVQQLLEPQQSEVSGDGPRVEIFQIVLNKGERKLGFTVATREFTTDVQGDKPCFVKTVHRDGAAAQDGRMKPNDILLEVNGMSLKGMSQQEVVNIMRGLTGQVTLLLKRSKSVRTGIEVQTEEPAPVVEPEPSPPQQTRTMLTLEIPLITPAGKSIGLGISVKGKSLESAQEVKQDFGIFVKKILDGGAAQMDGRLQPNDQLISTDGESLCGRSNKEAMQILKRSLQLSTHTSSIILVIARKGVITNLEIESRNNKHYSSFNNPRGEPRISPYSGLAQDPDRFRAMSLSSPSLGKKKNTETDAAPRGVMFDQVVLAIPNNTRDDGEDDVVFVSELPTQLDPFNRDNIFRKSMKQKDTDPVDNKRKLHRAASHESLNQRDRLPSLGLSGLTLKRGLSTESIFSGPKDKSPDPIYAVVEPRARSGSIPHNQSFQAAIQTGPIPPALPPPLTDDENDSSRSKSKNWFNLFRKAPKKREDSISSQQSEGPVTPQGARDESHLNARPQHASSPKILFDRDNQYYTDRHREPSNNSRDSREQFLAPRPAHPQYNVRDHPRAPPQGQDKEEVSHRRSRSSDYQRDAELAAKSGLGYIEHPRRKHPASRDHSHDRNSNHSNKSRDSGERMRDNGRDMRYRDEAARHSPATSYASLDRKRDNPREDHRYNDVPLKTKGFQYSNSLPPRQHYPESTPKNYEQPRLYARPSYQPMISAPISQPYRPEAYHNNGRDTPEQLSDV